MTKEIDVIAISNRKEVHTTETIHRQKEQKAQERKYQLPTSAIPPIEQATIRKALAPFSIICQNMTQIEFEQCSKREQIIYEAFKKDRDSKFAKMGTWKITKMVSKDGRVCLRTKATDKLDFLLKQIKDPAKRVTFYDEQVELRDKYLGRIRQRRRRERAKAKKVHPKEAAKMINKGMNEGEKIIKEGTKPRHPTKTRTMTEKTRRTKKADMKGLITIKTKNVNSIMRTQGSREEAVLTHLKQTQKEWDAWIFTETWRPEQNEIIDFEAEAESDEEPIHQEHESINAGDQLAAAADIDGTHKVSEPTRRSRHCLFACGGKNARGVAIVINARHAKNAEMDAVNENVCAVNLRLNGQRTCIIAVYMPHAGKCSEEHESVYTELSKVIKQNKGTKGSWLWQATSMR